MEVDDRGRAVFSHGEFGSLLSRFVRHGRVRYDTWSRDVVAGRQLDTYLDRVARVSPDSAPNLFPTRADRALYWVCAHNAFAIRSILEHWPVNSVTDIRFGWEPVRGYGYFRKARFTAGGKKVSLTDIVRRRLPREAGKDARVMLLINCGSASCAPLRADLPTTASFEGLLASATAAFLSDPGNLSVDHAARTVRISPAIQRARQMIVADPRSGRARGKAAVHAWLATVAPPPASPDLAMATDYALEFGDWDWTINSC